MLSRTLLTAAFIVSAASFVSAAPRVIITGSHTPGQNYIVTDKVEEARPYTLTGREQTRRAHADYGQQIRVGNRVVVPASAR
jgi:hypothetical protein